MALEIFIDESGYTGENLLHLAQPIFALSSINLDEKATSEVYAEYFTGARADELKHSRLVKRPSGRQRMLGLVRTLALMNAAGTLPAATGFAIQKRFQLLTLIIDLWVEPAMHYDGIDLYKDGGNLALSNWSFGVLSWVPEFFGEMLRRFEPMMRRRTAETYEKFWRFVRHGYENASSLPVTPEAQRLVREVLVFFLIGEMKLGPRHLLRLPQHCLDVAFSTVHFTASYWDRHSNEPLRFILDESKYFAEARWIWDQLTRRNLAVATFRGSGNSVVRYPMKVQETRAVNSKQFRQLQFADILAGAMATLLASRFDSTHRSDYVDALEDAGILSFCVGVVWPSSEATPEELETSGMSGEHFDYIEEQLRKASR